MFRAGSQQVRGAALAAPWKVALQLRRWALLPIAHLYFAVHGVRWGRRWRVFGLPLIHRHRASSIRIGHGLEMRNWYHSSPLGINGPTMLTTWGAGARIAIGSDVGMSGARLCALTAIEIGDRVRIGANCTLVDTDFHALDPRLRWVRPPIEGQTRPIVVEDDVFLGTGVLVLKGVRIGRESVVGAGSVVTGDVEPGVIVAGNPARVVRELV